MILKKLILTVFLILTFSLYASSMDEIFPVIEGWTIESEILTFHSENLWEQINGAADQFIDYNFVQLQTCDLKQGNLAVTIEIYEMSSVLNAFGIYSAECPAESKRLAIGGEGVVLPPGQLLLYKDVFYIKIYAYEGEIDVDNGTALLKSVANALPGENGLPAQLKMLPQKNKTPGSEGYILKNYSGLTELSRCIFAQYTDSNGDRYRLFCILPGLNESIENIWDNLKTNKWQSIDNINNSFLYREVPYKGFIGIHLKNDSILGISYTKDMQTIFDKLKYYD